MLHKQLEETQEYLLNRGDFDDRPSGRAAAAAAAELLLFWKETPDDSTQTRIAAVDDVISALKKWRERTIGK